MPTRKQPPLGRNFRKAHPKVRMIADGSLEVNKARSQLSSTIRVASSVRLEKSAAFIDEQAPAKKRAPRVKPLTSLARGIEMNLFVGHEGSAPDDAAGAETRENLSTRSLPIHELKALLDRPDVAYVEAGEALTAPDPARSDAPVEAPALSLRSFDRRGGEGVLVGIVDVEGFDFAHPDFLTPRGTTRFERIWDQGGDGRLRKAPRFGYGSEISGAQMNEALERTRVGRRGRVRVGATDLEPQSQMVAGSHGTHVASIAAGNRGICRKAFLAGVLVSLGSEDLDRRRSFSDSTRIANAVDYLFELAETLKREKGLASVPPVVINISLGTNGHAHDGTSAACRWMDAALGRRGRCICIAAGNAGQESPQHPDDLGYVLGRIHTSGRVPARGLSSDLEWNVVGNGRVDLSENELEIWYSPADRLRVTLVSPSGERIGPLGAGSYVENKQLPDGTLVSVYNELYHRANGHNSIAIYLSPFFSNETPVGVEAGTWKVKLEGVEVRDGRYNAWIERDDPRPLGRLGEREFWRFPSFFSQRSNVDESSIGSIACGFHTIAVANLDSARSRINVSSSQGPTRDGRLKPDLAAPGTEIVAARGFDPMERWTAMTGTSMASPHVAGVAGLLLSRNPRLTSAQIRGVMQRTASPLPGSDFSWRTDLGYGVIAPRECLAELALIEAAREVT